MRERVKTTHPIAGRLVLPFVRKPTIGPESQPTKAWDTGAAGEERVAEVLADVVGIEVLHDRRVPRSKANIDHIVVGPAGVYVIDAKKYGGKVELVDRGSMFRSDWRLHVAGRNQTKLVDAVLKQVEVVRTALGGSFDGVPVIGVLCFVGAEWGWFARPQQINGVTVLWPLKLPEHVGRAGEHGDAVGAVAARLRTALQPAV